MSVLVGKGAVASRRQGVNVYYSLTDKKIGQACSLIQEVIVNIIRRNNKLISKI